MTYTLPADIADRPITVVGGGTLGRRIALMLSLQGAEVRVFDTSLAVARAALEYVATAAPPRRGGARGQPGGAGSRRGTISWTPCGIPGWWSRPYRKSLASSRQSSPTLTSWRPRTPCWPATPRRSRPPNSSAAWSSPERVLNMHFYMPPDSAFGGADVQRPHRPADHRAAHGRAAQVRAGPAPGAQAECRLHLQPDLGGDQARIAPGRGRGRGGAAGRGRPVRRPLQIRDHPVPLHGRGGPGRGPRASRTTTASWPGSRTNRPPCCRTTSPRAGWGSRAAAVSTTTTPDPASPPARARSARPRVG